MKRLLIGCIPLPSPMSAFGIPVYRNEKGTYEFHKLSEDLKSITGFDEAPEEIGHMVVLPESMQKKDIEINNDSFFVITTPNLLFVGTAKDLAIYADGMRKVAGEHFTEELNIVVPPQPK